MPEIERKVAAYFNALAQAGMALQGMRIKDTWEPEVMNTLGGIAGRCMSRLEDIAPKFQALPPGAIPVELLRVRLVRALEPEVSKQTGATKDVLRKMVREEAKDTGETISLGGLACRATDIGGTETQQQKLVDKLACCNSLDKTVAKSFVEVTGQYAKILAAGGKNQEIMKHLEAVTKAWRNSLERLACTTLHLSANKTREKAVEAMV